MYDIIEEAIRFAFLAHKGAKRRSEDIDFAVHPITVGFMLKGIDAPEEVVIAGILHDVVEDTEYTIIDIKKRFGPQVARYVSAVSESGARLSWIERKEKIIERLRKCNDEHVLNIEVADKLHNLLSDYGMYQRTGKKAWQKSLVKKRQLEWFYRSLLEIAKEKNANLYLIRRFENIINVYFV